MPGPSAYPHLRRLTDRVLTQPGVYSADISYTLTVPSSRGPLKLPQTFDALEIHGRQSKMYITDYTFGAHGSVLHTTATVFIGTTIGSRDVLFLTGDVDQSHEVALILAGHGGKRIDDTHVHYTSSQDGSTTVTTVTVRSGRSPGLTTLWDSDEQLVLFSDPVTAGTFWSPPVRSPTSNTIKGLETFWQFGTNTTVLVGGPYLVRNATIEGSTLVMFGDLNASVPLTIVAPPSVKTVSWNGAHVAVHSDGRGVLSGRLDQSGRTKLVTVPALSGWRFQDSLPEIGADFDDSDWVVADHTSTNITQGMLFGDGRVLYGEWK